MPSQMETNFPADAFSLAGVDGVVRILGFAFSGHPEVFTCQHLNRSVSGLVACHKIRLYP